MESRESDPKFTFSIFMDKIRKESFNLIIQLFIEKGDFYMMKTIIVDDEVFLISASSFFESLDFLFFIMLVTFS